MLWGQVRARRLDADELVDWPPGSWVLLDCDNDERCDRLAGRSVGDADEAIADARAYRPIGPADCRHPRFVERSELREKGLADVGRELVQL
jgi:hypothetical protein